MGHRPARVIDIGNTTAVPARRAGTAGPDRRYHREGRVYLGALEFDILLGDVHSLKEKRSVIRPILAELQRFGVSTAEAGEHDRYRRTLLGVGMVSAEMDHLTAVLDRCERHVAARPELQLLAVRRRVFGPED